MRGGLVAHALHPVGQQAHPDGFNEAPATPWSTDDADIERLRFVAGDAMEDGFRVPLNAERSGDVVRRPERQDRQPGVLPSQPSHHTCNGAVSAGDEDQIGRPPQCLLIPGVLGRAFGDGVASFA